MLARMAKLFTAVFWLASTGMLAGCGAVYPEVATPLKEMPAGKAAKPPPPSDLLYIKVASAKIPRSTRDGRSWDEVSGDGPDPFVKIFVGGEELIRTPVESDTFEPTWPGQAAGNYRLSPDSVLLVELWEKNPLVNRPICVKKILDLKEQMSTGEILLICEGGARVRLQVAAAQPKLGLGLYLEIGTAGAVRVSRLEPEGPAARAGLKVGDSIISIMGKSVRQMEEGEAQSLINANSQTGVKLVIERGGQAQEMELKDGPVYIVQPWYFRTTGTEG